MDKEHSSAAEIFFPLWVIWNRFKRTPAQQATKQYRPLNSTEYVYRVHLAFLQGHHYFSKISYSMMSGFCYLYLTRTVEIDLCIIQY